MKRIIYLIYYIRKVDYKELQSFLRYSISVTGKSGMFIMADVFFCVFKYNISLMDYFYFRFFQISGAERDMWAGTGFMYEYQLKMNPKRTRKVLEDKILFLNHFNALVKRKYFCLNDFRSSKSQGETIFNGLSDRLVLKGSHGQVGAEVEVISTAEYTYQTLIEYMIHKNYDLIEEYVIQHPLLMELSPTGLNTVRIFTQLHEGMVYFLAARLRISVNSQVDNMGAGNLAAPVDLKTGVVKGPGVFSDISMEDKSIHPVSGCPISGLSLPNWDVVLDLVKKAALNTPENKSVGWDVAITDEGAELIEGNHNWCKILWQLPVKKGLKNDLQKYL